MAEIRVKENETLDSALRRFKRQIDHTTSVSIEIPNALGELISPEPVEVNVKIGKKDDYAGSVYAYYIDENNHIYNTSYVMFEIEYRKQ